VSGFSRTEVFKGDGFMTTRILVLCAGLMALAVGGPVWAHHSFSATYDSSQSLEIEGTVKEFVWRNPHSFLRLDVTDKAGTTKTWALEWGSTSQLAQSKMTRTTLKPGDKLVITGQPSRDQNDEAPRLLVMTVKRLSDGWGWSGRVD
jgi:hypothetical protein